jgi:hypothetical protein
VALDDVPGGAMEIAGTMVVAGPTTPAASKHIAAARSARVGKRSTKAS